MKSFSTGGCQPDPETGEHMDIRRTMKERIILFDGAMGTMLQKAGIGLGELPESWNLLHPDTVIQIHKDYLDAGADMISTNTFGANRLKIRGDEFTLSQVVKGAFDCAHKAVRQAGHGLVALDLGPTGRLLKPMGDLDFEEAVSVYAEVVELGVQYGADAILIETMSDMHELKAAVLAAKEHSSLPVFATCVFDESGKMLTGGTPKAVVAMLEGLHVDALGTNCSLGPRQMLKTARELLRYASVPVICTPNAGLPRSENGETVYDVGPEKFAEDISDLLDAGVSAVGGCCGTTPGHIRAVKKVTEGRKAPVIVQKQETIVTSYAVAQTIGKRPVIVGERINPTGKKKMAQALRDQNYSYILDMALEQQGKGAHILDVNVGVPGTDETSALCETIRQIQSISELPLQIDTSSIQAMEAAMRVYNGKPMVNSVSGKKESMDAVFPLVKKYGGVVVALALDENGIPDTSEGRVRVAGKILEEAKKYGIPEKDIIIDCLCMTVSADPSGALVTLDTLKRVHEELKAKTILGVSNISFGLPQRAFINQTFFTMALQNGLNAAIINPCSEGMKAAFDAYMVLTAEDENCGAYISTYADFKPALPKGAVWEEDLRKILKEGSTSDFDFDTAKAGKKIEKNQRSLSGNAELTENPDAARLIQCIRKGLREEAQKSAEALLLSREALEIINQCMIPALNEVGKDFEQGKVFLPQLLMSAEAARGVFAVLKERMEASGQGGNRRGSVILATVKGDIHDIGKNIVKVLLESYRFDVIDLGRDVPPETVVETAVRRKVRLVGLSALMTTTVANMEETIRQLHEKAPDVKIMVGGAVMTERYAASIHADRYCKDAMASVQYAEEVLG